MYPTINSSAGLAKGGGRACGFVFFIVRGFDPGPEAKKRSVFFV